MLVRNANTDRFKAVIGILTELGYVENWTLTEHGTRLLSTFHELDLVIAESVRAGHLDDHEPPALAGLVSTFVFEPRRNAEGAEPWFPNDSARSAAAGIARCVAEVQRLESAYGLPATRDVDAGLFAATYGWASGGGLADILGDEELSGGDFVRSMKQVIDVLSQVAIVASSSTTRANAKSAIELVQRGIVDAPMAQDQP